MEELDGRLFGEGQPCFGCSPDHPMGFRLRFERQDTGIATRFVPRDVYQGPPGIMHGGLVMCLGDEVAAWAVIAASGRFGFTTKFEGRLRKAVKIEQELVGRGWVDGTVGRLAKVEVRIEQSGETCFEARYQFAVLGKEAAEKVLGGPLPEAWQRFARD